jgi:hypothetical protein
MTFNSGIIVVALGLLFFFGGAVWLEFRTQKQNSPDRQDTQPQQPAGSTMSTGRTGSMCAARSE